MLKQSVSTYRGLALHPFIEEDTIITTVFSFFLSLIKNFILVSIILKASAKLVKSFFPNYSIFNLLHWESLLLQVFLAKLLILFDYVF